MATIINLSKIERERVYSPCDGCQVGWYNVSQYIDPKTGDLMQKSEHCSDTCERLKMTRGPRAEKPFGENIREAIDILRGR